MIVSIYHPKFRVNDCSVKLFNATTEVNSIEILGIEIGIRAGTIFDAGVGDSRLAFNSRIRPFIQDIILCS